MRKLAAGAVLALVMLSMPLASMGAASLPDPTRPPDVSEATEGAATPSGLQAIVWRSHGGSVAVINGRTVAVGDKVGDARLVSLTATEAVLSGPNGKTTLKLAPAVDKKPAPSAVPKAKMKTRIPRRGEP